MSNDKVGFITKLFRKKPKGSDPVGVTTAPSNEPATRSRSAAAPQEVKRSYSITAFSHHPKADLIRSLWADFATNSTDESISVTLNRLVREYNPSYMEWAENTQLSESGYYPTHTNMENNIDRWIISDNLFSYVTEVAPTYLSKSKKSSIPTVPKDLAARIMDLLNSSIKAVRTRCDATSLTGSLLDVLYLLSILSKSSVNCDQLMGESTGVPSVDVPRAVFQIFGELLSVTMDLKGDLSNSLTLIFYYCLVILKNFGPVSRNFESLQFMDARILKVLTRLMVLLLKHTESDNTLSSPGTIAPAASGTTTSTTPTISGKPFSWREYSLFVMVQHTLAVALTKRPEIRPQLRELKVLEEIHLKFLGRPPSVLPSAWMVPLAKTNMLEPALAVQGTRLSDPFVPMNAQLAVVELLASAFLDLPSIQRWSAIGGFKSLIATTLWISKWLPDPNMPLNDSFKIPRKITRKVDSSSSLAQGATLGPAPTPPTTSSSLPALPSLPDDANSTSTISALPSLPVVPTPSPVASKSTTTRFNNPAGWDVVNPRLVRLFEAYFHMCLCTNESEPFNPRIMSTLCGIFDKGVLATPENTEARNHLLKYPEAQLSFICLLTSLHVRNYRCSDQFLACGVWETLINSGFFLQTRDPLAALNLGSSEPTTSKTADNEDSEASNSSETEEHANWAQLSKQLHKDLSNAFYRFIELLGSTNGRSNETEVMILCSIISSPLAKPYDKERAASTLLQLVVVNPVPTATSLLHMNKHLAVLLASNDERAKSNGKPFLIVTRPTLDEKRKNSLNNSVSGVGRFLYLILDTIDQLVAKRGHYLPDERTQLETAKSTLVMAVNKLVSSESIKAHIQQDNVMLNDVFLLLEDPNPNVFGFGLHWLSDMLRSGTPAERAKIPTFLQTIGNRLLDYLTKSMPTSGLAFEVALLDSIAAVCTSVTTSPPTDLQDLMFQGHIKVFALVERVIAEQSKWSKSIVNEFVVSAVRVFSAMLQSNHYNTQVFVQGGGFKSLDTILNSVAVMQHLSRSLLIELVRLMMDGRDEVLHLCMRVDALPTRVRPPNAFLVSQIAPLAKRVHSSRQIVTQAPVPLAHLPANAEHGDIPGSYITPNLLPSPASSTYEHDEVISPEPYEPPQPQAAALIFGLLTSFDTKQQVAILDIMSYLTTKAQSANVTLSFFCAEGLLSKALNLVRTTTDPSILSRLFTFVSALGRHTITVRDIGQIFSLLKPLPGDFRPPWSTPLLAALDSMIAPEDDSPPYYFHFDGVDACLVLPPVPKFPLGRGFSVCTWINFEDFSDPLQRPNYQPRLLSFLDNYGRGIELVVIRKQFAVLLHRDGNRTDSIPFDFPKDFTLKTQNWYFLTLTYSTSTSLLSKQGIFKLYIGDRLIDKGTSKLVSFNDLTHCYVGSCNNPEASNASHSNSNNSSTSSGSSSMKEIQTQASTTDTHIHRSTNSTFYGYMSEINFFDEEVSHQHVTSLRTGISKESFLKTSEWNAVFDPMAQASSVALTMSYSPRNTTATLSTPHLGGYDDPYRLDPHLRAMASEDASHICYDSSPYNRDAYMNRGLHVVYRTRINSLISCVSGGANVLIPLFQLIDKADEMTAAQIASKRSRAFGHSPTNMLQRAGGSSTINLLTPAGNSHTMHHASTALTNLGSPLLTGLAGSTGSISPVGPSSPTSPPTSPPNSPHLSKADESTHSPSSTPRSPTSKDGNSSSEESELPSRWSRAKLPKHRDNKLLGLSTTRLSHVPGGAYGSSSKQGAPKLLRAIFTTVLNILHSSGELQRQIYLTRGFELISFLLVRSSPTNMSTELLDLFLANMAPGRFPIRIHDGMMEHLIMEAHLWVYTPYNVQQKLFSDCLQAIFVRTGKSGNFRNRIGAVSRLYEIIRIYYWETGAPANVMASEPAIDPLTGDVIAARPIVPQLRTLRKLIYSLISALILKETALEEVMRREFSTICLFLKDCSDGILVSEMLDYLEECYRKIPFYFEKFLEYLHASGSSILLAMFDNRSSEVRVKVISLINSLIQSKFILQHSAQQPTSNTLAVIMAPDKVPVVFGTNSPLPSPLVDFPLAAMFDRLASQSIDQALYDAIISLVFLLPPYYRGKYLLNQDTGEASIIRIWPALAGLARLLSGKHVTLQTLLIDDISFLITGNDVNLENMLAGAPTWLHWFLSACVRPAIARPLAPNTPPGTPRRRLESTMPTLKAPDGTSVSGPTTPTGAPLSFGSSTPSSFSAATTGEASTTPSTPHSDPIDPLERLHVKAVDTLKNIATRIITLKSGSQLIVEWYSWFRYFISDDGLRMPPAEAEYFDHLFFVVCREIVLFLQREIETTFAEGTFQNFLTKSSVPVPVTATAIGTASKPFLLSLSNSVAVLLSIAEYALQTWSMNGMIPGGPSTPSSTSLPFVTLSSPPSVTLESPSGVREVAASSQHLPDFTSSSPGSGVVNTVGSSHSNFGSLSSSGFSISNSMGPFSLDDFDSTLGFGLFGKTFNVELVSTLLKIFEKLETELERFTSSVNSPTEIFTYRAKWGFRGPGSVSLTLRLTCALFTTNAKPSLIRSSAGNITRAMSAMTRKVTLTEVHFSFYSALMSIYQRYKDPDNLPESAWGDMITAFFLVPLCDSNEVMTLMASSKHYEASYTEFLKKFTSTANLNELINQPTMEIFMSRLKKKLTDLMKEEQSARKGAKSTLSKLFASIRSTCNDDHQKERMATKHGAEASLKAIEKSLSGPRVLDPKTIRENYTRSAYRWRDTLRVLKGEFGPWGNNKPTVHWKLSRVESANRMRPFFKRNYHFNDHKDAAYSAKAQKRVQSMTPELASLVAPNSVKRLRSYNLKGFLRSEESPNDEMDMSTLQQDQLRNEEEDILAAVRLDSRMGLPTADGSVGTPSSNPGSSNARVASRISMNVGASRQHHPTSNTPTPHVRTGPTIRTTCLWIRPMQTTRGTLEVSPVMIRFKPEEVLSIKPRRDKSAEEDKDKEVKLPRERSWPTDSILEIRLRRYLLQPNSLELFFADRTNHLFSFQGNQRKEVFAALVKYCPPSTLAESRSPEQILRSSDMTKRWQMRQISNFEYLMYINTLAGRTFNDLSQYPVFPWIIKDMSSAQLDLSDPNTYRDLSKPIGALNPNRLEQFLMRYETFSETDEKWLYGSHYSSAAIVLFYLIRVEPFTTLAIELQDGSFDISDRMFNSIPQCWSNCLTSSTDVKELIPEFFFLPDFLTNSNNFPLGTLHTGVQAGDVQLPPWARTPDEFVATMRRALESDYVSEHLHEWIDLIFGYKQRGLEAVNANNVFYYMSYEGMVNLDDIHDPTDRQGAETAIRELGQTPSQVLRKPHPPRGTLPIPDLLSLEAPLRKDEVHSVGKGRIGWVAANQRRNEIILIDFLGKLHAYSNNLITNEGKLPHDAAVVIRASTGYDQPVRVSPPHSPHNVRSCVLSKDGALLFSSLHDDNSIRILSLDTFRNLATLNAHKDVVTCLALSEDGALLVSGSKDTTVRVWAAIPSRATVNAPLMSLNDHDDEILHVAIHVGLGVVASSSKDGSIILHYLNSSEYIAGIRHPKGAVYDLIALSPLGFVVAYCHADTTIYVYSLNGRLVSADEAPEFPKAMLLTKDGEFIITGGRRGSSGLIVSRRIIPTCTDLPRIHVINSPPIWSLSYSHDENYLLAGLESGQFLIKEFPSKRLYFK